MVFSESEIEAKKHNTHNGTSEEKIEATTASVEKLYSWYSHNNRTLLHAQLEKRNSQL